VKKKVLLLSILLIPSLIYFFFELTQANFKKMAFYGPKSLDSKGDTIYYTLPDNALQLYSVTREHTLSPEGNDVLMDKLSDSIVEGSFIAIFIDKDLKKNRLNGLLEYEKFKQGEIRNIPVVLICGDDVYSGPEESLKPKPNSAVNLSRMFLEKSLGMSMSNFKLMSPRRDEDLPQLQQFYFKNKPTHIMYDFAVLVDSDRHIRGYYDPNYTAEVKRMIQEYKHLVIKEEHKKMEQTDKINKSE
jgi:hypothetical protein